MSQSSWNISMFLRQRHQRNHVRWRCKRVQHRIGRVQQTEHGKMSKHEARIQMRMQIRFKSENEWTLEWKWTKNSPVFPSPYDINCISKKYKLCSNHEYFPAGWKGKYCNQREISCLDCVQKNTLTCTNEPFQCRCRPGWVGKRWKPEWVGKTRRCPFALTKSKPVST